MIALIHNTPKGGIEIMLFQDRDREAVELMKEFKEYLWGAKHQVFILEAKSLAILMRTHRNWFDKLSD